MLDKQDDSETNPKVGPKYDPALISSIRNSVPQRIMSGLSGVQPIGENVMEALPTYFKETERKG